MEFKYFLLYFIFPRNAMKHFCKQVPITYFGGAHHRGSHLDHQHHTTSTKI